MIETSSWIAAGLTLASVYLTGRKEKTGWIIGTIGSVIWCVVAFTTNQWALLVLNLAFFCLQIHNYYRWATSKTI